MQSLFTPLKAEGLTTLKIRYNWKTDEVRLFAAKEWEKDLDFSNYNNDYYAESILTENAVFLNTKDVKELFARHDLADYLEEVIGLIRKGKHFGMECYFNEKYNIRFMCNQHSRKLGVNNKLHATLAGGIRRHGFEDSEIEVIIDGLNLGRAMSFKNVAAELSFGGCKTTVHMDPLDLNNLDMLGFLAYAIDKSRTMTGPDMNFPTAMADVINEHFSMQYTSGPKSPLGETGIPTAYGAYLGLKQAVKFVTGSESLDGMSIAVQGLGAVGWYMAGHLVSEDTKLIITDVNEEIAKKFISENPNKSITYVKPDEILDVEADILCPCAIGGIIHEGNIPNLKFKYVFGPANNTLRASSQEEEIKLANLLADRGILFQTEWWHNSAGVMCGAEEYLNGKNAKYENVIKKIENTIPRKTWDNLTRAKELGITPAECVYLTCQETIYGE